MLCVYKYTVYTYVYKYEETHRLAYTQEHILRCKCLFCLRNSERLQRDGRARLSYDECEVAAERSSEALWNGNLTEVQWARGSGGDVSLRLMITSPLAASLMLTVRHSLSTFPPPIYEYLHTGANTHTQTCTDWIQELKHTITTITTDTKSVNMLAQIKAEERSRTTNF